MIDYTRLDRRQMFGTNYLDHDSIKLLQDVDPRLACTVLLAARTWNEKTHLRFRVSSGLRTRDEQRRLMAAGKSWVSDPEKSYHVTARAVDLAILSADRTKAHWDFGLYQKLNQHMVSAAMQIGLHPDDLTWGGSWKQRDGVHWQVEYAPLLPYL